MEMERKWEELQLDCLVFIFQKLSIEELTLCVPFVCKSWFMASKDPNCFKVVNLRGVDFMPWSNFTKSFISRYNTKHFSFSTFFRFVVQRSCGSVTELMLPSTFGASFRDLAYASTKCPSLKVLGLPDNFMLEDDLHIPELIASWKELEELELESKPCSFKEIITEISRNCRNFKRLKLCGLISKEDAFTITQCLPEIKSLELSKSYLTNDVLLAIIKGCNKLERLTVENCLGFVANEEVVRMASGIQRFEHKGSKLLDDYGYETDEAEQQAGVFFY